MVTSITKRQLLEALEGFPDETEIVLDLNEAERTDLAEQGKHDDIRWYALRLDDKMDASDESGKSAMCWLKPTECIMRGANDSEMAEILPWLLEHSNDDEPTFRERPESD